MRVLLVHPPVCDPTMPPVALPLLAAVLRREGIDVSLVDANLEALDWLLESPRLGELEARVRRRFQRLEALRGLSHPQRLAWLALHDGLAAAASLRDRGPGRRGGVPAMTVEDAKVLLRGQREGFYEPARYGAAADTLEAALRLVSAAHAPLELDLRSWRTPFAFLAPGEVKADAAPERNPFHPWLDGVLCPRVEAARVGLVGISVVFPGQLQGAWSTAWALRRRFPSLVLVAGGPALTQRLIHLPRDIALRMLEPFDAAVLGEGEEALPALVREAAAGRHPRGLVPAAPLADLAGVPRPAFEDLPLGRYLSPEPVLPYDASRGCFWGRCAFCHYGPVACGTAAYRERPMGSIGEDLAHFRTLGARVVYLSHDTLAPALGDRLAGLVEDRLPGLRWASDLRPDRVLDPGRCARWARGGALAFSLGLESGSQRVLDLMDKGLRVEEASAAVRSLAQAGLAVEAMLFLGFPTETAAEARKTLEFLDEHHPFLSLFMCGTFGLTEGSRVAREPGRFGVEEVYRVQGDELRTALFWTPGRPGPTPRERQVLEARLEALSARWRLRPYPWAGSLSTAHTLLWVDRHGPAVFREAGPARPGSVRPRLRTRHDLERLRAAAMELEAAAWNRMIFKDRRVGREEWRRAVRELGR